MRNSCEKKRRKLAFVLKRIDRSSRFSVSTTVESVIAVVAMLCYELIALVSTTEQRSEFGGFSQLSSSSAD